MNEVIYRLLVGVVLVFGIAVVLIVSCSRVKKVRVKPSIQYFGDVYFRITITTFAAMFILCGNIYEFIIFQICNMFAAALISQYIINTKV